MRKLAGRGIGDLHGRASFHNETLSRGGAKAHARAKAHAPEAFFPAKRTPYVSLRPGSQFYWLDLPAWMHAAIACRAWCSSARSSGKSPM